MWMSVLKAQTTVTLMLTVLTLLEVSSAHVVLVTLETGSLPAMVRKKEDKFHHLFTLSSNSYLHICLLLLSRENLSIITLDAAAFDNHACHDYNLQILTSAH